MPHYKDCKSQAKKVSHEKAKKKSLSKAFVVKNTGNAKLKVQFFWPFKGDYWVIDLADDYSYAVVSNPDKKSLWILSRTSKIDTAVYQQFLKIILPDTINLSDC